MASIEGYGGRGGIDNNAAQSLVGLLGGDTTVERTVIRCANPKCFKPFLSRANGDEYCCQPCEFDHNPNYKAGRNTPHD